MSMDYKGSTISETFLPTTYPVFSTLTEVVATISKDDAGSTVTLALGPGGIGWIALGLPSSYPELPLPTNSSLHSISQFD